MPTRSIDAWALGISVGYLVVHTALQHVLLEGLTDLHYHLASDVIMAALACGVLIVAARNYEIRRRRPVPMPPLSARELEVTRLVASGLSTKEIALRLSLSPKTVDAHRVRIYKKLDVHDRVTLTRLALQRGWLEPE